MALEIFGTKTFNPRVTVSKAADYTVLATDELVTMTGATARTFTLPSLDSFQNTLLQGEKVYKFINAGTANLTVQPGTSAITGVVDTIHNHALWTVLPNESIFITGYSNLTNWLMSSPAGASIPILNRFPFALAVTTNGVTPVNIIDANGAPTNINITAILSIATVTLAGNVIVKNGTDTALTLAKSTTIGGLTANAPSAVPYAASAAVFTVEMSVGSADCVVIVFGTAQTYV